MKTMFPGISSVIIQERVLYGEIRLHTIEVEKIAKMIERPPAMNREPLIF